MSSRLSMSLLVALCSLPAACGGASAETTPATPTPVTPSEEPTVAPEPSPGDTAAAKQDAPPEEEAKPLGEGDTRTMEAIAALVKAHRKEARTCYEDGQKQIEGLKGDLVVHFVLKPSGEVKLAELNKERSTIAEPSVVKCVIGVVTAIQFPKSSKGLETTVNYPFNFNPNR